MLFSDGTYMYVMLSLLNLHQEYGVKVVAIDLSSNMIKIGMERAEEMGISLLDVINLQHELTQTV